MGAGRVAGRWSRFELGLYASSTHFYYVSRLVFGMAQEV